MISIKIDSGRSDEDRWNTHRDILSRFNAATISSIGETWYDASYPSFDAYIAALRGQVRCSSIST